MAKQSLIKEFHGYQLKVISFQKNLEKTFFPLFNSCHLFPLSLLTHILAFPIKSLKEARKCIFWKLCFWVTVLYDSLLVCKLYILGYEIFNKHNFDALPPRNIYFTKQIVYTCAPLLPNGYPGGCSWLWDSNHIFSTNNGVESYEIW